MAPRKKQIEEVEAPVTETVENDTIHVGDLVYDRSILDTVISETATNGFGVVSAEAASKLVELGLIEVNPAGADENGNVQAAATDKGREAHAFNHSDEGKAETESVAKKARRKSDVVTPEAKLSTVEVPMPPDAKRGRQGGEKYPFASLTKSGPTQTFHIPTSHLDRSGKDEILSRMYSSVSTANDRYKKVPHPTDNGAEARYKAREVGADDPDGEGVRVWRIA